MHELARAALHAKAHVAEGAHAYRGHAHAHGDVLHDAQKGIAERVRAGRGPQGLVLDHAPRGAVGEVEEGRDLRRLLLAQEFLHQVDRHMQVQKLQPAGVADGARPHHGPVQPQRLGHGIEALADEALVEVQKVPAHALGLGQAQDAAHMAHGAQGQQYVPAVGTRNMHHTGHGVHILAGVQLQRLAKAQAAVAQQQEQQMQPGTRHLALGRGGLGFPLLPAAGKGFQFFSGQMGHCGGSL